MQIPGPGRRMFLRSRICRFPYRNAGKSKILNRDVARYALAALAGVHPEDYNLPCLTIRWEGEL